MIRAVLGVVVGYLIWSAIWLGGNTLFFTEAGKLVAEGKVFDQTLPLMGAIVLSVIASLVSGALCALIAQKKSRAAGIVLGLALLGTGVAVQASIWTLEPIWFHLTFLILLMPATVIGASFVKTTAKPT